MNPDEHGSFLAICSRRPDVEVEAILSCRDFSGAAAKKGAQRSTDLGSNEAKFGSVANVGPGLRRLGWLETEWSERRLSKRYTFPYSDGITRDPSHLPI